MMTVLGLFIAIKSTNQAWYFQESWPIRSENVTKKGQANKKYTLKCPHKLIFALPKLKDLRQIYDYRWEPRIRTLTYFWT